VHFVSKLVNEWSAAAIMVQYVTLEKYHQQEALGWVWIGMILYVGCTMEHIKG
jgi:hypothetical protein